ncbi:MAG: glycosyltransferase family 2 protein [Bacteroidaceae bacterium]|nr:glycosyltransferase family 2 protein [Bacteroidaceae bacterium]
MKLSILIPTFNQDCTQLVHDLLEQLPQDAEIIVADDGSTAASVRENNATIAKLPQCRFWQAKMNLGRAKIRNLLAEMAKGEWILFIDSDAQVRSKDFIASYLKETDGRQVICGGTGNFDTCPSPDKALRYKYEVLAERKKPLKLRRRKPYAQFSTFNFMILRDLFMQIRFCNEICDYGHEDTLFGLALKDRKIPVLHIDNKLIHTGLEPTPAYLRKIKTSLFTLSRLDEKIQRRINISAIALFIKKCHLKGFATWLFNISSPRLKKNLLGSNPSLLLFKLYKLGFFCKIME